MLDMLNVLDQIEIKGEDRISEADMKFCTDQETIYFKAYDLYSEFLKEVEALEIEADKLGYATCIKYAKIESENIKENIECITSKFISKICYHFITNYNVTINEEEIQRKYKELKVTKEQVIDEVIEQLGGLGFEDKAEQELIEKMKEITQSWRDEERVKVSKNKISIKSFFAIDSFSEKWGTIQLCYGSRHKFETLFKIFAMYNGINSDEYTEIENRIKFKENIIREYILVGDKTKSIKLFKNGRVDITFTNSEYALEFRNKYCS